MRCAERPRARRVHFLGVLALALGCHSDSAPGDLAEPHDLAGDLAAADLLPAGPDMTVIPTVDNVVPIVVDQGPTAAMYSSYNVPFITVKLCVPGTTNCQTIDHVSVDTGSSGLRVLASALSPSFIAALTPATDASSHPLAECYTFADGYVWGSVKKADLSIGGESAAGLAFQVVGDPAFGSVPTDCSDTGTSEDTLDAFGANALIGVGLYGADCGTDCLDSANFGDGYSYYGCATPSTCAQVVLNTSMPPAPTARMSESARRSRPKRA